MSRPLLAMCCVSVVLSASSIFGASIVVYPTGDSSRDVDILQAAIDGAADGDVVTLNSRNQSGLPTPFVLGKTTSDDVTITTATGTFRHMRDFILQLDTIYSNPLPSGTWHKPINIHKRIAIRGEADGSGHPVTRITVPDELRWTFDPVRKLFSGFQGSIIINAPGVTLENLIIDNLVESIYAYSPGFTIQNCEFTRVGSPVFVALDDRQVYPQSQPSPPVRSYIQKNTFSRCVQGIGLTGSEVVVRDNRFDILGVAVRLRPLGEVARSRTPPLPVEWGLVEKNVVESNTFEMNGIGSAIQVTDLSGGTARSNVIRDNTIRNCGVDGIWLYATSDRDPRGIFDTEVEGNSFENVAWPLGMLADRADTNAGNVFANNDIVGPLQFPAISIYSRQLGIATRNTVTGNRLIDVFRPNANRAWPGGVLLFADDGGVVADNAVVRNDYRASGLPGVKSEYGMNGASIILSPATEGNFVFESGSFPRGTGGPNNQILDFGQNNRVIGHSANGVEKPAGIGQRLKELFRGKEE